MATELTTGQHVSFLRMNNKAIKLTGVVQQINEDGKTVRIQVDGSPNFVEDAHVDDVNLIEAPAAPAAEPRKSFVTVNGQAI